jgi:hypothetical protein
MGTIKETGRMRLLIPGHGRADPERSEANRPEEPDVPVAAPSGPAEPMPDSPPPAESPRGQAEGARGQARPSEGLRILLEKIDTLTARVQACEQSLQRLAQQTTAMADSHAAERKDLGERIRQRVDLQIKEQVGHQVGQQIADLSAEMERRQKGSASKQARLLELLAAEISKVRSIAEAAAQARHAGDPGGRPEPRPAQPRRRPNDAGTAADMAFLDPEELLAGLSPQGGAAAAEKGADLEFWDWLDQLPRELPDPRAGHGVDLDELDRDDHR